MITKATEVFSPVQYIMKRKWLSPMEKYHLACIASHKKQLRETLFMIKRMKDYELKVCDGCKLREPGMDECYTC